MSLAKDRANAEFEFDEDAAGHGAGDSLQEAPISLLERYFLSVRADPEWLAATLN
jgi:hypothetical protein